MNACTVPYPGKISTSGNFSEKFLPIEMNTCSLSLSNESKWSCSASLRMFEAAAGSS